MLPGLGAGLSSPCPGLAYSKAVGAPSDEGQDCVQQRESCVLAGVWDGEYVCLGAAAGCASGERCLAGSSDSEPLRKPKRIYVRCFGNVIICQDASGKTCGGHAAEDLLMHGVTLVHPCSLLSGVGKCGRGRLGHV